VFDTVLPRPGASWGSRPDQRHGEKQGGVVTGTQLWGDTPSFQKRTLSAHEAATWHERATRTLQQFPRHWLRTNLTSVMPIVAGMLTIVVLGAFPRRMALELPHITATYWQFEHLCEVRSDFSQGLNTLNEVLSNISGFVFGTAIYCAMVAANVTVPLAVKYLTIPFAAWLANTVLSFWVVHKAGAPPHLWWDYANPLTLIPMWIINFTAHLCFFRTIGRRINDSSFWWKYMLLWFISNLILPTVVFQIWVRVPYFSDTGKAAYVVIAHPIIFELFLTAIRLLIRSLPEHHESAAWVQIALPLVGKTLSGRLLVSLIRSSGLAFIANVHLPLVSEDWRDRQLYRAFAWCSGAHGPFNDPTKHWRNVSFRERYLQAEVVFNLIFAPTSGFFIWWLGISLDGENAPDLAEVVNKVLVQYLALCFTTFWDALYTEVIMRRPMLITVHRNFRGYHLYLAFLPIYAWFYFRKAVSPLLGRMPLANRTEGRDPTWLFLTEEVLAAINVSTICAEFPSATVFAEYYSC